MKKKYYKTPAGYRVHTIMPNGECNVTTIMYRKGSTEINNWLVTVFEIPGEEITPTQFFEQCLKHISVIQKTLFEL